MDIFGMLYNKAEPVRNAAEAARNAAETIRAEFYDGFSSQLAAIGKLEATNLITNGNYANTTGWTTNNGSVSVSGGEGQFLATAQFGSLLQLISGLTIGRKLYFSERVKATSSLVRITMVGVDAYHSGSGLYERLSGITTVSATAHNLVVYDNRASGWNTVSLDDAIVIDLTAVFGAGNEPTAAQMDALLARWPNSWFDGTVNFAQADKAYKSLVALKNQIDEKTGYGVVTGGGVTAQATPNMTVAIAGSTIYEADGMRYVVPAVASQAINTADATNPRIDIIYERKGVYGYLAGTAAASPSAPATPAGGLKLAEISVAAGITAITSAMISLRKKGLWTEDRITPTLINGWAAISGERTSYTKGADGFVDVEVSVSNGTNGTIAFTFMAGYRPGSFMTIGGYGGASTAVAALQSTGAFTISSGSGNMRFRFRFKAEA